MAVTIDISELAEGIAALPRTGRPTSVAVLVPFVEGRDDVVRAFLAEGPPFDPAEIGIESHTVFLTEREAIFVFDAPGGVQELERILTEPDFWDMVASWQRSASGKPRLAVEAYSWRQEASTAGRP